MNIRDFKVLLDKRVYHNLEGQWRDLFARLKWDTVKSALKSVAGLQGRKFKVFPLILVSSLLSYPAVGLRRMAHWHHSLNGWHIKHLIGCSAETVAMDMAPATSRVAEVTVCHAGIDAWDVCGAWQQRKGQQQLAAEVLAQRPGQEGQGRG